MVSTFCLCRFVGGFGLGSDVMSEPWQPQPLIVDHDTRPGMGWNMHICLADVPDSRIAFMANFQNEEVGEKWANLLASAPELFSALFELVYIIERAGVGNLSRGVQLGQISWADKCNARVEQAKEVIERLRPKS